MSNYTPGPWESNCIGHGTRIEPSIAWVGYGSAHPNDAHKANARLIAAAPDGHEFAKAFLDRGKTGVTLESLERMARAYLAKATGKEPS